MKHFRLGQKVRMTENALENYGDKYKDTIFKIAIISKNEKEHPGYDNSVYPDWLYDLKYINGKDFPNSLYDYELKLA